MFGGDGNLMFVINIGEFDIIREDFSNEGGDLKKLLLNYGDWKILRDKMVFCNVVVWKKGFGKF